jgi:hypothetical protein
VQVVQDGRTQLLRVRPGEHRTDHHVLGGSVGQVPTDQLLMGQSDPARRTAGQVADALLQQQFGLPEAQPYQAAPPTGGDPGRGRPAQCHPVVAAGPEHADRLAGVGLGAEQDARYDRVPGRAVRKLRSHCRGSEPFEGAGRVAGRGELSDLITHRRSPPRADR